MSEPTTGEWTVQYVSEIANKSGFQELVEQHNAALAAEGQKCRNILAMDKDRELELERLEQQLAAEREKVENQQAIINSQSQLINGSTHKQLQQQLAAERKKVDKLEGWCEQLQPHYDSVHELQKQLAAERENVKMLVDALERLLRDPDNLDAHNYQFAEAALKKIEGK